MLARLKSLINLQSDEDGLSYKDLANSKHGLHVPIFWDLMLRLYLARVLILKHLSHVPEVVKDAEF